MAQFERRRRRQKHTFPERRLDAELIRQHGARGTRELLSRLICLGTLLKFALAPY